MNRRLTAILFVFTLLPLTGKAVEVGDTAASVSSSLGEPVGIITAGNREVLVYANGRVTLVDGVVTQADLLDPAALAHHRAQEKAAADGRQQARIALGTRIRDDKRQDPDFAASSGLEQLAFWRAFHAEFPEVVIDADIERSLEKANRESAAAPPPDEEANPDTGPVVVYRIRDGYPRYMPSFIPGYRPPHTNCHPHAGGHAHCPPPAPAKTFQPDLRGSIMSTMDRIKGANDAAYSQARAQIYARAKGNL